MTFITHYSFDSMRAESLKRNAQDKKASIAAIVSSDYDLREKAGIGFHDTKMPYFKGVLVPIMKSGEKWKINPICHVHHLPNNYIHDTRFCNIQANHEFSLTSM